MYLELGSKEIVMKKKMTKEKGVLHEGSSQYKQISPKRYEPVVLKGHQE